MPEPLTDRDLNRALLARQGLLTRFDAPVTEVVEAIGAMQGQAWGALPPGLWSRIEGFTPADLYDALARGDLLWGIGIRGTLHLVSAREHPAYAVISADGWTGSWHRALEQTTPGMDELRAALLQAASATQHTNRQVAELAEAWVAEHPEAIDPVELEAQRAVKWRPIYRWSALVRVPANGAWTTKTPADHRAAPVVPGAAGAPGFDTALAELTRRHLRAFGPAAAEDVACWTGARTPAVRAALERLEPELETFADEHGRTLYDLPGAPRPPADAPAPPRLLGAFDSTLLAYAVKRRDRIVSDALREVVYDKRNLRIQPTFLVDGLVAGTWAIDARRREVTLTLTPAAKLARADRTALTGEAEALLRALYPDAKAHAVSVA